MNIGKSRRLTANLICAISIALVSLSSSVSASSQADLDSQIPQLNDHIRFVRSLIAARGTPEAMSVDGKVNFVAVPSLLPFASSQAIGDGHSRIQISSQFRLLLAYFTELNILSGSMPMVGHCLISYREMIEKTHQANLHKVNSTRGPVDDIPSPERYAIAMGPQCVALENSFPISEELRGFRNHQVNLAIAFTYFHELGHLSLGHHPISDDIYRDALTEEDKMKIFLESMKHSREQEYEADRWAVREMMHLNAHPLELMTPALSDMMIATSGIDCRFRLGMTHPDPVARISNIIMTIRQEAVSRTGTPMSAEVDQLFSEMISFREKVEKTLDCPSEE